jgi:hypothetical protein
MDWISGYKGEFRVGRLEECRALGGWGIYGKFACQADTKILH